MAVQKEKRCYTVKEIQEILNISKPSVYNLLKKGDFHSVFVAGRHIISKASFDAWLNGYEIEHEDNVPAVENRNEHTESVESYQTKTSYGAMKPVNSGFNSTDAGANQEREKYQEMQEKILQTWIKTYLLMDSAKKME